MNLLVFAHLAEAGCFIQKDHFQPVDGIPGCFKNHQNLLVVLGEGQDYVDQKLTKAFEYSSSRITKITNHGTAGSLTDKCFKEKIFPIGTFYGEDQTGFLISQHPNPLASCITADQRSQDPLTRQKLSQVADLVDRELWAIGKWAKQRHLPLFSYKLVTDFGDQEMDLKTIKKLAPLWSEQLYNYNY